MVEFFFFKIEDMVLEILPIFYLMTLQSLFNLMTVKSLIIFSQIIDFFHSVVTNSSLLLLLKDMFLYQQY